MKKEGKILKYKQKPFIICGVEITRNMTIYDFMAKLKLPPRGPKGDPGNIERVMKYQAALQEFGESYEKRMKINDERK